MYKYYKPTFGVTPFDFKPGERYANEFSKIEE